MSENSRPIAPISKSPMSLAPWPPRSGHGARHPRRRDSSSPVGGGARVLVHRGAGGREAVRSPAALCGGDVIPVLREAFQSLLDERLALLPADPFATPLRFNGSALHRYPPGRLGISPHRDSARSINLIAVFVPEGKGRFFVCRDRDGRDAVDLPNAPGDLILLRAPGLMGTDLRPFHGIADIVEQRTTFALREQQTGP